MNRKQVLLAQRPLEDYEAVVFLAVKRLVYQDPAQLPPFTPESIELRHEILAFGLVLVPPHQPTGKHDRHVIPLRHGPEKRLTIANHGQAVMETRAPLGSTRDV